MKMDNCGSLRYSAVLRTLPLTGSLNTTYTAHFVRPNFGFAETSYMLEPLYAIGFGTLRIRRFRK